MDRIIKRQLPRPEKMRCACTKPAVRFIGTEGICARCAELQRSRELLCHKGRTSKKWSEPEPDDRGARFWKEKLEFWLPNPTPGWGSLATLEARLRGLGGMMNDEVKAT